MELSSQDVEIPIPINSSYGGHMIHHHDPSLVVVVPHSHSHTHTQNQNQNLNNNNNIINQASIPSSNGQSNAIAATSLSLDLDHHHHHHHQDHDHHEDDDDGVDVVVPYTKKQVNSVVIRYRECLKNHAAAMGGAATDGCGEFMPSGEEGTIEALTCSACNCHRNFHRKEVEGEPIAACHDTSTLYSRIRGSRKLILGHGHGHNKSMLLSTVPPEAMPLGLGYPPRGAPPPPPPLPYHHHHHHQMISYNIGGSHLPSESDEQEDGTIGSGSGGGGGGVHLVGGGGGGARTHLVHGMMNKKRFRTKFSQEQKEKMLSFAEKVGWRIQKQEEGVVQQFCQEIGVKRRVLKVWMHNNKHSLTKKHQNNNNPSNSTTVAAATTTNIVA